MQSGCASMFSSRMPARASHRRLARFKSTRNFSPIASMHCSASAPSVSRSASGTSACVSKQQGWMEGPSATRMFSAFAPYSRSISRTTLYTMPSAVPRQPACAAPIERVTGSKKSAVQQSEEKTTSGSSGTFVTSASASKGRSFQSTLPAKSSRASTTVALCT